MSAVSRPEARELTAELLSALRRGDYDVEPISRLDDPLLDRLYYLVLERVD